jgi:hypothetical protein
MKAGVGFSERTGANNAVRDAFERAEAGSGHPALSFVFTTDAYEPASVWQTLKDVAGDAPFVGFQCGGVLTGEDVLERGIGVATISGELEVATALGTGLDIDPWSAGQRAGQSFVQRGPGSGLVVVLPDSFPSGIYEVTRSLYGPMGPDFRYVGGASGDNLKFLRTCQFTEASVEQNAVAVAVVGGCQVGTAIGHGWQPYGEPLVITQAQGKRVFEIDGRPAFRVYCEHLGIEITRESFHRYATVNPFGFADISGNYVIRDTRAVNDDDSLVLVTEVPANAVAVLMRGEVADLVETAADVAARATAEVRSPALALVFDCVGRYLLMGDAFGQELRALSSGVGVDVPFLGALSFGEIGSFKDVPLFHNKTVAVAVLGTA